MLVVFKDKVCLAIEFLKDEGSMIYARTMDMKVYRMSIPSCV